MRVKLYECDQPDMEGAVNAALNATECDLAECFPGDPEAAAQTEAELNDRGWCYVGGGAAQLYLVTVVKS